MKSSPRNVQGAQGAQSEASVTLGSGNSLDGSTSKLKREVEALLVEKTAAEAKASKLEEAITTALHQKVRRKTAVFTISPYNCAA